MARGSSGFPWRRVLRAILAVLLLNVGGVGQVMAKAVPVARLTIRVRSAAGLKATRSGTLVCSPDSGTGAFRTRSAARSACAGLLASNRFAKLALDDALSDVCTQEFGGRHVVQISGVFKGISISVTIARVDGCQIDLWDELEAVVGKPT